jgi:hypothetical protein
MNSSAPFLYRLLALNAGDFRSQGMSQYVPSTPECVELNRTVVAQAANGQTAATEGVHRRRFGLPTGGSWMPLAQMKSCQL